MDATPLRSASPVQSAEVQHFVGTLARRGIRVIEWGPRLQRRYGCPWVCSDFDFLIDDDVLQDACSIAKEQGFHRTESVPSSIAQSGEFEVVAHHFGSLPGRLNLFPRSFAGFRDEELDEAPLHLTDAGPTPVVLVAKLAPLVASLIRLMCHVPCDHRMRLMLETDLSMLICYTLFDMSYEGDYMVLEWTQEEMDKGTERALELYRKWKGWRKDELWIADAVEWYIRGKARLECLPRG